MTITLNSVKLAKRIVEQITVNHSIKCRTSLEKQQQHGAVCAISGIVYRPK